MSTTLTTKPVMLIWAIAGMQTSGRDSIFALRCDPFRYRLVRRKLMNRSKTSATSQRARQSDNDKTHKASPRDYPASAPAHCQGMAYASKQTAKKLIPAPFACEMMRGKLN